MISVDTPALDGILPAAPGWNVLLVKSCTEVKDGRGVQNLRHLGPPWHRHPSAFE